MRRALSFPKGVKIPKNIYRNIDRATKGALGITFQESQKKRNTFLSPSLSTFQAFKHPFLPKVSFMQYLWDHKGQPHLDLLAQNLTISVGHNHPQVLRGVKDQFNKMTHCTTMYHNETTSLCAEKVVETLPKLADSSDSWVVHFVNSGSEAADLAMMMARAYTRNYDVLSLRNAYHGLHSSAQGITGMSVCKQPIPHGFGVKHVAHPDLFRPITGNIKVSEKELVNIYAQDVANTITYETSGQVAGFIYEQVQGYGGINVLPKGYVSKAAEMVRNAGGLIIADEVQSGFRRMGNPYFWSFEMEDGFVPDMIITAKGLGNGFPIAAVMTRRKIAESITNRQFFNTYGGNPTVCAAAIQVLDILNKPEFGDHVTKVGQAVQNCLQKLYTDCPIVGNVRGHGLMHGIEITENNSKQPNPTDAADLFERIRNKGIIMGLGGLHKNVLRFMPPMCIQPQDVHYFEEIITEILREMGKL